ncbi:head-tail connector protein [Neomegalonema sp.]|uniref:head-tail connector protein n=1 Tax=Neomegalonema sp. TaxID=2039713 RepID=UPI002615A238|nr:head-tail connector protein [Neomegalonema sp.]MDD2869738.1 head-tail connector protein [Neomegalonema sp.]
MHLLRVAAPENLAVSLEQMKLHLRIDHDFEDALIVDCIWAATERLDGRDGALGGCLITQVWKLTLGHFQPEILIPLPPCQSVDEVVYLRPDGEPAALAPADYQVAGIGSLDGATLRPAPGKTWPIALAAPEAVAVTFTAGFGDDAEALPEPIRASIRLRAAHLYEHRESVIMGSGFITEAPDGADDFARNYRQWGF